MAPPPRAGTTLGRLPTLPVFLKLRGRRVVLAGGGEPAIWKADVLCAAGASVEVFAADPCDGLVTLSGALGSGALRLVRRPWRPEDLVGAVIALAVIDDDADATRFRSAAVAAGVLVNIVDKPAFCDFQFGTLVDRSPLVLAVSTDGAAPVLAQAIRARVEALLPGGLRAWAEAAQAWRPSVQAQGWGLRQRRRFWDVFAERALQEGHRDPSDADQEACRVAAEEVGVGAARVGWATLVGCGRGTLDDVTFGVARALQAADIVVYDDDVRADVVNLGRRESPKEAATASAWERVAALVTLGKHVAWLGTGDPTSCDRWSARADQLVRLGAGVTRLQGLRCPACGSVCQACGSVCQAGETLERSDV